MPTESLVLKNITKKFNSKDNFVAGKEEVKEKPAVNDVSFSVEKGEIYGLIGPNGSGKTTTIKMIMGLYQITGGEIKILGKSLKEYPKLLKKKMGYIPDHPFLYDRMSGREFLKMTATLHEVKETKLKERLHDYLEYFPIEGILDAYTESYSRGNKQKLTIIAALMHNPEVLVIDEPIRGLDPRAADKAAHLFERFVNDEGSILMATHSLAFAEEICDRFGLLTQGKLAAQGSYAALNKKAENQDNLKDIYLELTQ